MNHTIALVLRSSRLVQHALEVQYAGKQKKAIEVSSGPLVAFSALFRLTVPPSKHQGHGPKGVSCKMPRPPRDQKVTSIIRHCIAAAAGNTRPDKINPLAPANIEFFSSHENLDIKFC